MDPPRAVGAEFMVLEDEGGEFRVKRARERRERGGEGFVDEVVEEEDNDGEKEEEGHG